MAGSDDTSNVAQVDAVGPPPPPTDEHDGDALPERTSLSEGDLAAAFARIDTALAGLDATVDGHLANHLDNAAAAAEVQRLNADRARLARALDEAEARAARLDEVNRDVSRRLVAAMETIRDVLEGAS